MSISLCLIVKNEARHIKKCLTSFKKLSDEIIVVDTGSKDGTKTIAKNLGAHVFDYKWHNDFSAARNFAISKAAKKWIMVIDADDVIEENSVQKIKKYLKNTSSKTKIISLPYIYSQTDNQHGQIAWLPRIWQKSLNLKYIYPVHEHLDISKVSKDTVYKLQAPIIHKKSDKDFETGFKRNVKIMSPFIKKHPHDLRMLYYLIHDNRHLGKYKKAIYWCEKYFKAKPDDPVKLNKIFTLQGICYLKLKDFFQAQACFLLAIGAQPKLIEPYLQLGDLYYWQKRYEEAIQMYRYAQLCKMPKNSRYYFNQAAYDYFAERKLAYVLPLISKDKEALKYAKKVLKFCPKDEKLINHIANLKKKTCIK